MSIDVEFDFACVGAVGENLMHHTTHGSARTTPVRGEVQNRRSSRSHARIDEQREKVVGIGGRDGAYGTGTTTQNQSDSNGKDRHDNQNCDPCHGFSISLRSMFTFSPDPSTTICEPSA